LIFRVHFVGGGYEDVAANNPTDARRLAIKRTKGIVTKIKVLRGTK